MGTAAFPSMGGRSRPDWRQFDRIRTLGAIVLAHAGLLVALRSGAPQEAPHAKPGKEVIATFITPRTPRPELPQPQPVIKKPAPARKAAPPKPPKPSQPLQDKAPAPRAVSEPPAPPAAEPAAAPEPVAQAAPAAPPAPPAAPKTVSSGVEYIRAPQPEYPMVSRRMGEQGKVVLRVLVNEQGRPERIEVQQSSGSSRLDEAARQAVARSLIQPYIEDGRPVAAYRIVPIRFQLDS